MNTMENPGGIVAIAAHPDDEVLGCGGVLALHARNGEPVTIVIVCEGESLRYGPEGVGQAAHPAGPRKSWVAGPSAIWAFPIRPWIRSA